jgi:hypothetical protein
MSGKPNTSRTPAIVDPTRIRCELSRMARKWGWTVKDFTAYCLRMGVNRALSLERYGKPAPKKVGKRSAKRAKIAKSSANGIATASAT